MTRQEQIEATRASYRAAIQRAEKLQQTGKVHTLNGALRSLEAQWASERRPQREKEAG